MGMGKRRRSPAWKMELDDLIRGACGGFLFGIPLLYTMEVWWIGSFIRPPMMILAIAVMFVIVFLLNRTAGFRQVQDINVLESAMDSVEVIALGFLCTALVLALLGEIDRQTPLDEGVGKLIYESVPFTLGVALANQFLSGDRSNNSASSRSTAKSTRPGELHATLSDIGGTLIGSTIIAASIAPTDEVDLVASALSAPRLLALIGVSLMISYAIVFEAGFANQQRRMQQKGIFQRPDSETLIAYLVSLIAAAFMLCFFQQLGFDDPWTSWLRYTLVLGLPATVGGAAGRLAV